MCSHEQLVVFRNRLPIWRLTSGLSENVIFQAPSLHFVLFCLIQAWWLKPIASLNNYVFKKKDSLHFEMTDTYVFNSVGKDAWNVQGHPSVWLCYWGNFGCFITKSTDCCVHGRMRLLLDLRALYQYHELMNQISCWICGPRAPSGISLFVYRTYELEFQTVAHTLSEGAKKLTLVGYTNAGVI